MAQQPGFAAFQGNVSRLVCDFNRDEHLPATIPIASDGHAIPGNAIDHLGHEARLARFFRPYHAALEAVLAQHPPALILSLHSFTPQLASSDEPRPWQRSEEHTSELQSLMRISYAVFCLKKKNTS